LADAKLPDVRIAATRIKPRAIAGVATTPRFRDRDIPAVEIAITNAARYRPVETGVHLLAAFQRSLATHGGGPLVTDAKAFDRLAGTDRLRKALARGVPADDIVAMWDHEIARFTERRAPYLAY
jgi:uncharacterized protein YbbC (DUF1343 family)